MGRGSWLGAKEERKRTTTMYPLIPVPEGEGNVTSFFRLLVLWPLSIMNFTLELEARIKTQVVSVRTFVNILSYQQDKKLRLSLNTYQTILKNETSKWNNLTAKLNELTVREFSILQNCYSTQKEHIKFEIASKMLENIMKYLQYRY